MKRRETKQLADEQWNTGRLDSGVVRAATI